VTGCTFTGNGAGAGGGAINAGYGGSLAVSGCTFSDNSAQDGGAIMSAPSTTIDSSTFMNNSATVQGGAIDNENGAGALTVGNSTFCGNTPEDIFGGYTDGGGNTFNSSC
jgi:predicted outer membrane repeat protein